ncbi:hypothetical protein CR513_10536, partial [Mucuna pruriens]
MDRDHRLTHLDIPNYTNQTWKETLVVISESYDPSQQRPPTLNLSNIGAVNSRDFQLAPTLEEYGRIMGMACHKSPPYLFGDHYPSWAAVAKLFKVPKSVVVMLKKNRNRVEGISEVIFEARLQQLQEGDWLTFVDVYGLLVYGIILFPHIECYVNLATIDAFLGKRDKGEHPVVAEERNGIEVLYVIALLVVDRALVP